MADELNMPENEPLSTEVGKQVDRRFTGGCTHNIDGKGRLIVPAKFRKLIGEEFVVGPDWDFNAIAIYPMDVWLAKNEKLAREAEEDEEKQEAYQWFNSLSQTRETWDTQGRVLLTALQREYLLGEDNKELDVLGVGNYIRVKGHESVIADFAAFKAFRNRGKSSGKEKNDGKTAE